MPWKASADPDRRRSPRFNCGGFANLSCLPSEGIVLPGMIRDLSLGGCYIHTTSPFDAGLRAELFVRVNAASFRAVGEVKTVRRNSGVGLEFVQLSAGGKDMLADLVTELARLQAIMNKLKGTRRDIDAASFKEELERGRKGAMLVGDRFPSFRSRLGVENSQNSEEGAVEASVGRGADSRTESPSSVWRVDFFG